jgi:hypothetical protein
VRGLDAKRAGNALARQVVNHVCPPHGRALWRRLTPSFVTLALLVLAASPLVYWATARATPAAAAAPPSKAAARAPATNTNLPRATAEMRDAILAAARTGKLDELRTPIEWNEMRPDVADEPVDDIIAHLRKESSDGSGRDILDALDKALSLPPAIVPFGRDIENNAIYVWPYLAERDLAKLTAAEDADLLALVGAQSATAIKLAKRWTWYRITIGADGTWHAFRREK